MSLEHVGVAGACSHTRGIDALHTYHDVVPPTGSNLPRRVLNDIALAELLDGLADCINHVDVAREGSPAARALIGASP